VIGENGCAGSVVHINDSCGLWTGSGVLSWEAGGCDRGIIEEIFGQNSCCPEGE
jgi:hypothetical protein